MWVSGCIFCIFWIACRNWNLDRPALTFPDCKSEEKERDGKWKGGGRCRRANPSARLQRRRRRQLIVSGRLSLISCTIRATHPSAAHYNWARLGGAQLGHYTGH